MLVVLIMAFGVVISECNAESRPKIVLSQSTKIVYDTKTVKHKGKTTYYVKYAYAGRYRIYGYKNPKLYTNYAQVRQAPYTITHSLKRGFINQKTAIFVFGGKPRTKKIYGAASYRQRYGHQKIVCSKTVSRTMKIGITGWKKVSKKTLQKHTVKTLFYMINGTSPKARQSKIWN